MLPARRVQTYAGAVCSWLPTTNFISQWSGSEGAARPQPPLDAKHVRDLVITKGRVRASPPKLPCRSWSTSTTRMRRAWWSAFARSSGSSSQDPRSDGVARNQEHRPDPTADIPADPGSMAIQDQASEQIGQVRRLHLELREVRLIGTPFEQARSGDFSSGLTQRGPQIAEETGRDLRPAGRRRGPRERELREGRGDGRAPRQALTSPEAVDHDQSQPGQDRVPGSVLLAARARSGLGRGTSPTKTKLWQGRGCPAGERAGQRPRQRRAARSASEAIFAIDEQVRAMVAAAPDHPPGAWRVLRKRCRPPASPIEARE